MDVRRVCGDDEATQRAGEEFARVLRAGDIVILSGPLGAGKTTFVKGVARGLGVRERVTSPTFTMVRQHEATNDQGIATLHHADVYRVENVGEILDLDLAELVEESGVALVEWGELAPSVFGVDALRVVVEVDEDDDERTLRVEGTVDAARRAVLEEWAS